ncbi:unnamed protein product [Caenorhabditis brenneri]
MHFRFLNRMRMVNPDRPSSSPSTNYSTGTQNSSPATTDQLQLLAELFGSFQTQFHTRLQKLLWVPDPPFPGSFSVENLIAPVQFSSSKAALLSDVQSQSIKQENLDEDV